MRAGVVGDVKVSTVQNLIRTHVGPATNVYTDEHAAYVGLAPDFHNHRVNHSAGEYVRHYHAHTSSIKSVWALLRRQIIDIPEWASPKHLDRYVGEMTYRLNRRDVARGDRVNNLLSQVGGRLTYKALTA